MTTTNDTADKPSSKTPKKNHKPIKWVIILFCVVGFFVLAIGIDIKLEDIYKDTGYTKEFENNFLTSCQAQGSSSPDCRCIYRLLKQKYTYDQAKKFDADPQSIETKLALDKIIGECKQR